MKKMRKPTKVKVLATKPRTEIRERADFTIGLSEVVRVLELIQKHGHLKEFGTAAKNKKVTGTFDAKTIHFVKKFIVNQKKVPSVDSLAQQCHPGTPSICVFAPEIPAAPTERR
jgi:hypothetical protein